MLARMDQEFDYCFLLSKYVLDGKFTFDRFEYHETKIRPCHRLETYLYKNLNVKFSKLLHN